MRKLLKWNSNTLGLMATLALTITINFGCNQAQEFAAVDPILLGIQPPDVPSAPSVEIPGEGGGGPVVVTNPGVVLSSITDTFNVGPTGEMDPHAVDVLWVVDNSGSMGNNQANLAANLSSFISAFMSQAVIPDFQMAVTTTDPYNNTNGRGILRNGVILTRDQAINNPAQFLQDFQDLVLVGTNGSGHEAGLLAARRSTARVENAAFFRQDAILAVNFLSDEYDYSLTLTGETVDEFVDDIKAFKGQERVIMNSIVNQATYGQYETRGEEYIQAAAQTNGINADILGDFTQALLNIGEAIVVLTTSFPLSEEPYDPSSMKVYVDGAINSDWSYDEQLNTVSFSVSPNAGALIEIIYETEVD